MKYNNESIINILFKNGNMLLQFRKNDFRNHVSKEEKIKLIYLVMFLCIKRLYLVD